MPWHYVRFLEEATERILLQRVGGGYPSAQIYMTLQVIYHRREGTERSYAAGNILNLLVVAK